MQHYFKTNQGFSLMELMLVIIVTGIIAILGVPRLIGPSQYEKRLYYNEALSAIRYANRIAVSTGCDVQVSTASNSITITRRDSCETGGFNTSVLDPVSKTTGFLRPAPSGIAITDVLGDTFYFNPLGQAINSVGNTQTRSISIDNLTITVNGETGYVKGS